VARREPASLEVRATGLAGTLAGTLTLPAGSADDPTLAAVVLLAGPARSFRETMRYQNRYLECRARNRTCSRTSSLDSLTLNVERILDR
jgi:hypothetical protein